MGVLYECVVDMLLAFPVCEVFAFGDEMWRWVRWWGLIGVGGTNAVCVVLEDITGRGDELGWEGSTMFVWGVLRVGMPSSCVVVVVSWCGILGLLGPRVSLWLAAGCYISGGISVLGGSLSGRWMWVGCDRLCLCVCDFSDLFSRPVVVCLMRRSLC